MRIKAASSGFFVVTVLFAVVWCADADDNQFVTDGLVSYWSFDEDSIDGNTVEDLWGSNDGTIMGNPGTVNGIVGEAMDFDGIGDYIDCGGDESLNITSDLSIEFWLNPRNDDENMHVVSRSTWGVTGYLVQNSSPTVHGQIFVFARFVYQGDVGPEGTTEVNTWQHIVLTYDSSSLTFSIYKNGSLYNSEPAEAGPMKSPPEGINFMIARYSADDTNHFDGLIDELRIYNRTLTADEVQQNYAIQDEEISVIEYPFVTDGLVSYWSFDEDSISGNTVEDLWGSNDGTIMGNPGTVTGAVGEAMDFDGIGDYIDCGGDESLNITSDLSIEFWLNPRDDDVNRHVVSRSTWGVTGYLVQNSSPTVHGQIFVFARFVYQGDIGPEGTTEVNTWQHIVLTYDSSSLTFSIYKNGSLYNSELAEAGPIKSPPEGINFMIARYSADDTNHFDGKIDELRIYNRALTDAEVQQNYEIQEEEAPVTEPGIKGDVNGDGSVRSNDAIMALRIVAGLMEPTEDQKWAADMNGDGNVRSNDAIFILRQVAGLTI